VCIAGTNLEELVFVVPTDALWKLLTYKETGLIKGDNEVLDRVIRNGLFRERSDLETDISFKQLIPYSIISNKEPECSGSRQSQSFLLFQRRSGQTEKRLHNKFHLGAGGHMNPGTINEPKAQYLINELKRELSEELKFLNGCLIEDIKFIGFINDDSIPVGTVHLGLLYDIHVSNKDVLINETDKMTAKWVDKTELIDYYKEMETWTKIAIDFYIMGRDTLACS
jgi:predicted NUDIX family phosphoesterase